jgi:hypothetical protein
MVISLLNFNSFRVDYLSKSITKIDKLKASGKEIFDYFRERSEYMVIITHKLK